MALAGCGSSASATNRTVLDFDSSLIVKTDNFETHGKWDVVYSWDCHQARAQGNQAASGFKFVVFNSDDDSTAAETDPQVARPGVRGQGTVHYANAGFYYLQVESLCKYRIRVLNVA